MPIFSYVCPEGHETERLEKEAKAFVRCPNCGKRAKRSWTPVGVRFHGPGFHNTDYKTQPDKKTEAKPKQKKKKD